MVAKDRKTCFVIMPISDPDGYDEGHFSRVYENIIKPACEKADLEPLRADDVKRTNYIVLDILKRTIESDVAICDLSAKNPNVLYELGIRQAFNRPVVLITDELTDKIFDIQGLRTFKYDSSLRIDYAKTNVEEIAEALKNTFEQQDKDVNSLIELLGITAAKIESKAVISQEGSMILTELKNLAERISTLENIKPKQQSMVKERRQHPLDLFHLPNGERICKGQMLYDSTGKEVGKFLGIITDGIQVEIGGNAVGLIPPDDELYDQATQHYDPLAL